RNGRDHRPKLLRGRRRGGTGRTGGGGSARVRQRRLRADDVPEQVLRGEPGRSRRGVRGHHRVPARRRPATGGRSAHPARTQRGTRHPARSVRERHAGRGQKPGGGVTVQLTNITAAAHRDGNRIDLSWTSPAPQQAPGVRVVRRTDTHPTGPDDGVVVAHGIGLTSASDTGLQGETVYYYTLFPFSGAPPVYSPDPHNQTSAMATAQYDFAGQIYAMLPAVYRRYDGDKGQLRRFLDLPGGELDRLYSFTRAALSLTNLYRVEGRLLPLLGDWIGWQTNHGLPVGAQRNEIRFAPWIYQTIGTVPNLDATVARITGWANRTKEFVHNVARTSQPERLNLWFSRRDTSGTFSDPAPASTNFAYDGGPTGAPE